MAGQDSSTSVFPRHAHGQPYPRNATPETGRGGVWPSPLVLETRDREFESHRPDHSEKLKAERRQAYDRQYHANRSTEARARKVALQALRRKKLQRDLAKIKADLKCSCGESHPACLEFHHRSNDKAIDVANATNRGWSLAKIKAEIEKCVVMCANCHRKLHFEMQDKSDAQA